MLQQPPSRIPDRGGFFSDESLECLLNFVSGQSCRCQTPTRRGGSSLPASGTIRLASLYRGSASHWPGENLHSAGKSTGAVCAADSVFFFFFFQFSMALLVEGFKCVEVCCGVCCAECCRLALCSHCSIPYVWGWECGPAASTSLWRIALKCFRVLAGSGLFDSAVLSRA